MRLCPREKFNVNLKFARLFFILVPDFQFMLFDPQLTITVSRIVFNWTPDFAQLAWKNSIQSPKILNFSIEPELNSMT